MSTREESAASAKQEGTLSVAHVHQVLDLDNRPLRLRYPVEYQAWNAMKNRCRGTTEGYRRSYVVRGIRVCERWLRSFAAFLEDMGPKPTPSRMYSLDRIDNDGNYEPWNCRWTTAHAQAMNSRLSPRARRRRDCRCLECLEVKT